METISRRQAMQALGAVCLVPAVDACATSDALNRPSGMPAWSPAGLGSPLMRDPIWVYDIWSAHTDGIFGPEDDSRLTEYLAMSELREIVRLKHLGVQFDYYMMNFGWYDPEGAYRTWRKADWPSGPDRWISACQENGIRPGLWFGTNTFWQMSVPPKWQDSVAYKLESAWPPFDSASCFEGGFLADFMDVLQYWYDRGIRMFEFDNANFYAATEAAWKRYSPEEIRQRNEVQFSNALKAFRRKNPDAMLVGFNGFCGRDVNGHQQQLEYASTLTPDSRKNLVDLRWLEVFDTLYCGDVRVSDVPQTNFWRSVDMYCDHMVRRYEQNFVPLERIDSFSTLSTTMFGYKRGRNAWKGMLLLSAARGGWKHTVYGNLELLSEDDAQWLAKLQSIYAPLIALGRTKSFGGLPGDVTPYGFSSFDRDGAIYTVMNPTQETRSVKLPSMSRVQGALQSGRVLFRDAGFSPLLEESQVTLGSGQLVVIGFGRYASKDCDLGIQSDVVTPRKVQPIHASFIKTQDNVIEATIRAPVASGLRIVFEQRTQNGAVLRSAPGKIEAMQGDESVPIHMDSHDKAGLSSWMWGISWGVGEIRSDAFASGRPIKIRCSSAEAKPAILIGQVYAVEY